MQTSYNGAVEGTYSSLPYGDGYSASGADDDAYHYAMLDQDNSSDDHAIFREYSNLAGRWMSPDRYAGSYNIYNPQSFNRYSYVMNQPLSYVDFTGQDFMVCGADGCYFYTDSVYEETMSNGPGSGMSIGPDGTVYCGDTACGSVTYLPGAPPPNTPSNPGAGYGRGAGGGAGSSSSAPNNGPQYSLRQVCAASALLNKGGQAFLDGLGMIPGEGNLLKGVQFAAGATAAGWTIFGNSSPMDGVLSAAGSGITAVDAAKVMTTGAEIVPVIGNFVAAYATYRDIWGSDGLVANYDNCLAGKN